ncbi:MAG: hypothetical protein ABR878_13460 [Roseiarcus sp.]
MALLLRGDSVVRRRLAGDWRLWGNELCKRPFGRTKLCFLASPGVSVYACSVPDEVEDLAGNRRGVNQARHRAPHDHLLVLL